MYTHEEFFLFHEGVSGEHGGKNWDINVLGPKYTLQSVGSIRFVFF